MALAGATLTPTRVGAPATGGQSFVVISNDGTDPVTGTFTGLAQGALLSVNGQQFRVSYTAVRVFVAASMADAIRQAEEAGATDITGIERSS